MHDFVSRDSCLLSCFKWYMYIVTLNSHVNIQDLSYRGRMQWKIMALTNYSGMIMRAVYVHIHDGLENFFLWKFRIQILEDRRGVRFSNRIWTHNIKLRFSVITDLWLLYLLIAKVYPLGSEETNTIRCESGVDHSNCEVLFYISAAHCIRHY